MITIRVGRYCRSSHTEMDFVNFIVAFFVSKNVRLLTAFVCWRPEDVRLISQRGVMAGLRLRVFPSTHLTADLPAYRDYREGVLLDSSRNRAFNLRYSWLLIDDSPFNITYVEETLSDVLVLPDGDVTWVSVDRMVDVYKVKADQPLVVTHLGMRRSRRELEGLWRSLRTTVTRRKNLHSVYLKSATIVTQPQYFKGWSDLSNRQIDTFPKLTYPILKLCGEDLNFRFNLKQVDLYGEERNGSFDGLVGQMQHEGLEVGVTSMFMRKDRWRVLHFCAETVELKGAFLFRQPSRSSVSNVFALPFSRGVWAASAAVFAGAATLLAVFGLVARRTALDPVAQRLTVLESLTYAVGTICQQGSYLCPNLWSMRLLMFCTLLASLFAFTSYSAKIVAILQAPSDALRTIDDLARSPMDLGVQETTYKRVYFAESKDPATQALYRRKLLPLGERAYLSVVDGIARVRTGLFAFQVEQSSAYDIISKTYTEREKCDLKEIKAFTLPMVAVPVRKHSGYKDLLGARLRWQREVGLMDRYRRVWMSVRTPCDAAQGGFVSVGLVDVLPALHALLAGVLLATALLLVEKAHHTVLTRA
ncbi:glutamate receptor ionotropic, kainate glr-3-like isoform X2 [Danaus plexippus]|uniref:glutamate receptor ionotropic, kainate glr-3-like isoform X2 n=1 Tax=Danaus plexippus TaxID=13037 RepID=UPI002AB27F03|nr:glutamate receptor ionotropic, kainate glr-3-like isoform X2 [Danaus plexippus]